MIRKTWQEQLTVDANIVRLLSAATYEDFPSAIRELVSNAYDADATEVKITVDVDKDLIRVADNGNGMSREEFQFFLRIAGQRRERESSPNFARKRIGQFGIGFLAVFPFGAGIKITSTSRRSSSKIEATIPAENYFDSRGFVNVDSIGIPVVETQADKSKSRHGVEFTISPLTDLVHRYFSRDPGKNGAKTNRRLKKASPSEIFKWTLQDDLPLNYAKESPYAKAFADLPDLQDFKVTLNGEELFRNSPGSDVLENDKWEYQGNKCRFIIATDWQAVPNDERGLKIRLNNVGVGKRSFFGLGTEGRTFSRLHWLTGEIRIVNGFDEILNIDRAKFRDSPEFDVFREFFRDRIRRQAYLLEDVSEATRDIERQFNDSRMAEVGPRKELVEKNLNRLENRGFAIQRQITGKKTATLNVDLKTKTVVVTEPKEDGVYDYVLVKNKRLPVSYTVWNLIGDPRAVRRSANGDIEINQTYPLFRSKRYGEIFRRIFVLLLLSGEQTEVNVKFQSDVAREMLSEFIDIL